jgi:hypothetical protein
MARSIAGLSGLLTLFQFSMVLPARPLSSRAANCRPGIVYARSMNAVRLFIQASGSYARTLSPHVWLAHVIYFERMGHRGHQSSIWFKG